MSKKIRFLVWLYSMAGGLFVLQAQVTYTEVAADLNVVHSYADGIGPAGGVSFFDFNNDGWDDLSFTSATGEGLSFYINNEGIFVKVEPAFVEVEKESKHLLWVDYDNDGDHDLFITNYLGNEYLFNNGGDFQFEDVTEAAGILMDTLKTFGASWGDYNRDGWLDLYVTNQSNAETISYNQLYTNKGDGTFELNTMSADISAEGKIPFCSAFIDIDNDRWCDLYIAQDRSKGNTMLRNNRDESFSDVSAITNTDLRMNAMCVAIADYNEDDYFDIYVSNTTQGNALFANNGNLTFDEVADETGTAFNSIGWGAQFADMDNDGDIDLQAVGNKTNDGPFKSSAIFIQGDDGLFEDQTATVMPDEDAITFSNAIGDFNNDGAVDLVLCNRMPHNSTLWENSGNNNHWLKVKLQGTISNRSGIGATIEVYIGEYKQSRYTTCGLGFLGQNSGTPIFGLGAVDMVDSIQVHWPSGHTDVLYDIASEQVLLIQEGDYSPLEVSINKNGTDKICEGSPLMLDAGLLSASLSYQWSTNESTPTIYVEEAGLYSVNVFNEIGILIGTDEIEVSAVSSPEILLEAIDNQCFEGMQGSISSVVGGGTGNPFYYWSNGMYSENIDNLTAGIYSLMVLDENQCSDTEEIEIQEGEEFVTEVTIISPTDNEENGSIEIVQISGGAEPHEIFWEELDTDSYSVDNLGEGDYTVLITDDLGCEQWVEFTLEYTSSSDLLEGESMNYFVYPNPVDQILYLPDMNEVMSIEVLDVLGKLIDLYSENTDYIDCSEFQNGIYYLKLNRDKETTPILIKFVKQ